MHSKFLRAVCAFISSVFFFSAQDSLAEGMFQLNYSPIGEIFADEENFEYNSNVYDKDELDFDYSTGARLLIDIYYVSYRHASAKISNDFPNATVDTYALGLGCVTKHDFQNNWQGYSLVGLGVGSGKFEYENPDLNDDQLLLEANIEVGIVLKDHFTLGLGVEGHHFGSFGESIATSVNGYFSAGVLF